MRFVQSTNFARAIVNKRCLRQNTKEIFSWGVLIPGNAEMTSCVFGSSKIYLHFYRSSITKPNHKSSINNTLILDNWIIIYKTLRTAETTHRIILCDSNFNILSSDHSSEILIHFSHARFFTKSNLFFSLALVEWGVPVELFLRSTPNFRVLNESEHHKKKINNKIARWINYKCSIFEFFFQTISTFKKELPPEDKLIWLYLL